MTGWFASARRAVLTGIAIYLIEQHLRNRGVIR